MSAWKLGLANVMLIGKDNKSCEMLVPAGYGNISCVWSEREWFPFHDGKYGVFEAGGWV